MKDNIYFVNNDIRDYNLEIIEKILKLAIKYKFNEKEFVQTIRYYFKVIIR
jgi:hypothetical protein